MRILILGGTLFLGRHLAEAALARGHEVTLFHRGRTNPGVLPEAAHVHGDRDGGLEALGPGGFDAVVDTSGYVPRIVADSAARFARGGAHYTFVSSISVYDDPLPVGLDESAPVRTLGNPDDETLSGSSYGGLKALCESRVHEAFGGRELIVRPGLIVGPWDPTDRFTWWPRRIAAGGDVLAPGAPELPVQLVDARDLAAWMLDGIERRAAGVFNATGPAHPLLLGEVLETCRRVTASDARLVWVDEAFLLARGVQPWMEMPLWVPRADAAFVSVDCRRAWDSGLAFRELAHTVRDTWDWDRTTPREGRPKSPGLSFPAGLDPGRERELLAEWAVARP